MFASGDFGPMFGWFVWIYYLGPFVLFLVFVIVFYKALKLFFKKYLGWIFGFNKKDKDVSYYRSKTNRRN